MKVCKPFKSPSVAQKYEYERPKTPRLIDYGSRKSHRSIDESETLELSRKARSAVDWEMKKVQNSLDSFQDLDKKVRKQRVEERREKMRREMEKKSADSSLNELWEEIKKPISEQKNHARLVDKVLARYRAEQELGYKSGFLTKLMGAVAHEFSHTERNTFEFFRIVDGPDMYGEAAHSDMAQVLKRMKKVWAKQKYQPFNSSGERFPDKVVENDVDIAGLQLRESAMFWGRKGVKFNDVGRDDTFKPKPQGADRMYDIPNSLTCLFNFRR